MYRVENAHGVASITYPMTIKEVQVSVGKVYLTEVGKQKKYFKTPDTDENGNNAYLEHDSVYTATNVLYETKEAAEQWVMRADLIKKLNLENFKSLSVNQLRRILDIVDELNPKETMLRSVLGNDLIRLFTNSDGKYVHFLGFGYQADGEYRCVEYIGNCIKLKHVLEHPECTADQFNEIFNNDHPCQISDVTEKELLNYYTDRITGELCKTVSREELANLKDGFYII